MLFPAASKDPDSAAFCASQDAAESSAASPSRCGEKISEKPQVEVHDGHFFQVSARLQIEGCRACLTSHWNQALCDTPRYYLSFLAFTQENTV